MRIGEGPNANLDWLYEVRNGRAFMAGAQLGGTAAEFGMWQLFNPAGSGITIFINRIWARVGATMNVELFSFNTALTTLRMNGANLQNGGAAGLGQLRNQTNVAKLGDIIGSVYCITDENVPWPGEWLGVLEEEEGVQVTATVVNLAINANFLWSEQ